MRQALTTRSTFIDISAADGYYAVGVLKAGMTDHALCFEISAQGQQVIYEQAVLNHVDKRISIFGEATDKFLDVVFGVTTSPQSDWVILIDIEGGEFDLLTPEVLERLTGATLIVEAHDFGHNDGGLPELVKRVGRYFDVQGITTGSRDLSGFPFLRTWSDDDRWLMCSEGRPQLMTWLLLTPPVK